MKKNSRLIFAICVLLIGLASYILTFGLNMGENRFKSLGESLKLGVDMKGGIFVQEEILGEKPDKATMERTQILLQERVNNIGVSEATVNIEGSNRFRIEIPGLFDEQEALKQIGETGELTFVGPDNKVILTGKTDIKNASVGFDERNVPLVNLELTKEGGKKFEVATKKFVGQIIKIKMDDNVISDPRVNTPITGTTASITEMKSTEEASRIANIIKSGALPVKLKPAEVKTIGASLGSKAIPTSRLAAIIGVGMVMLFMLIYYKLPGLIADLGLVVYIIIALSIFTAIGATLTLSGIAGFLLSVGMAVDANVLIFERMKEELALGKSLKTAIDLGFHRALSSILDSNITTLIAGFVLYYFGSGTVKGFALTLNIGVLVSMFTAITVTRFMLKTFANTEWVKNKKFYTPIIK